MKMLHDLFLWVIAIQSRNTIFCYIRWILWIDETKLNSWEDETFIFEYVIKEENEFLDDDTE